MVLFLIFLIYFFQLIAGRMFVRMEVIVSVLMYVLVGLDGKANTAEDVSLLVM
jgi:hypothetical protein